MIVDAAAPEPVKPPPEPRKLRPSAAARRMIADNPTPLRNRYETSR